ncbi:MAG: DUF4380 domain-containing protein [Bacteroidales bacterium]|nr:DUF4380 domain-containing protein [Bacteroidales bacterium]
MTENKMVQYIKNENVVVGVIPEIGGTIVFVSKNGSENLIKSNPDLWDITKKPAVDENTDFVPYCGHTVWLGPQKEWWMHQDLNIEKKHSAADWPPDPYLYIADYEVIQKNDSTIQLKSKHSPISGVTIEKQIAVNPDGSIFVQATVINTGDKPCAWDVWHNTRFDGKCKMSVSAKEDNVKVVPVLNEKSTEMPYEIKNEVFSYCPQKPPTDFMERSSKTFIYPEKPEISIRTGKYNFTILFELHKKNEIHPEQGLVEIYNHTEHGVDSDLLEVEYHSPYKKLNSGEQMCAWEVWKIKEV